jgi:hypothetical protein
MACESTSHIYLTEQSGILAQLKASDMPRELTPTTATLTVSSNPGADAELLPRGNACRADRRVAPAIACLMKLRRVVIFGLLFFMILKKLATKDISFCDAVAEAGFDCRDFHIQLREQTSIIKARLHQ